MLLAWCVRGCSRRVDVGGFSFLNCACCTCSICGGASAAHKHDSLCLNLAEEALCIESETAAVENGLIDPRSLVRVIDDIAAGKIHTDESPADIVRAMRRRQHDQSELRGYDTILAEIPAQVLRRECLPAEDGTPKVSIRRHSLMEHVMSRYSDQLTQVRERLGNDETQIGEYLAPAQLEEQV